MEQRVHYVIGAVALIGVCATARDVGGQPIARMTVHLVDYAHVAASDLRQAQREAADIYAAAGIELVWVAGNVENHPTTNVDVHVMLLDRVMSSRAISQRHLGDDVLGVGGRAGFAFVFVNRVTLRSISAGACFTRVLGRVIAHELGHLVLPANSHTSTGIMRADMDLRPLGERYFTPRQAETLVRTLTGNE